MSTNAQFPDEQATDGSFERQEDAFREWVTADSASGFPAAAGRYHLYVSLACPWACRTIIVRKLKGSEDAIGMTIVDPIRDERGWRFTTAEARSRQRLAVLARGLHGQRSSLLRPRDRPVLWDKQRRRIVSNSDDDIMRMLESQFDAFAGSPKLDLYPRNYAARSTSLTRFLYAAFNNGVYRAGFATSQEAYEAAAYEVFTERRRNGRTFGLSPISLRRRGRSKPIGASS